MDTIKLYPERRFTQFENEGDYHAYMGWVENVDRNAVPVETMDADELDDEWLKCFGMMVFAQLRVDKISQLLKTYAATNTAS